MNDQDGSSYRKYALEEEEKKYNCSTKGKLSINPVDRIESQYYT